jgi:methylated-DNA-[protein]-cysteine S-methyltransferase
MTAQGFALFATAIGHCGIAWNARGLRGVHLPEASEARTRARLRERFPGAHEQVPPPAVQGVVEEITALLRGEPRDLARVALDWSDVPAFNRRVYDVTRGIASGGTLSYGEIATRLGEPGSARAVGQALGQNPFPLVVPCHRVLAAGGSLGGFSANGGAETKLRLLTIERALAQGSLDFG